MLNARQVQILLLLWNKDCSGDYLSKEVGSSRRTIVRDVGVLNKELAIGDTAVINSEGKYNLSIHNYSNFQSLIMQFENQDRNILYYLLVNDSMSIDELMEKTLLSKLDVVNGIERINQRDRNILHISSKIGLGYQIELTFGSREDLLSYLISVLPENEKLSVDKDSFPNSLRSFITDNQLLSQLKALKLISQQSLKKFYDHKRELIRLVNYSNIENDIEIISNNFSIELSKQQLAEKITLHLKRYNLFPTFISSLLFKQMSDLKQREPFAFEMASELKKEIIRDNPSILVNSDFLALYIIDSMEKRVNVRSVRILMYTSQRSIAYINENVISEAISNIELTSIFNLDDFIRKIDTNNYDIVITNGFNGKLDFNPDIVINGLIDDNTIFHLKKMVGDNYFQNNLGQMLPKNHYLFYKGKQSNYFKVLREILKYFKNDELLDFDMSESLMNREEEGNQLVINHVAIPHIVSNSSFSQMFAVDLENPIELNGNKIYFILLVLVNDQNDDYKQLFNYLYRVLNKRDTNTLNADKSYANVIKFFNNK